MKEASFLLVNRSFGQAENLEVKTTEKIMGSGEQIYVGKNVGKNDQGGF